ncbi:acyltransferase [uncultured Microbulbifer sp.]|uniref:acyltransferase family protein n=1 Tax=uncultured Microbulbifer sp. TaxID=348147 RepID=UPI0026281AAF|nr:acyltransferase [uncultured Microbulbifer sp.]
MNRLAHLDALRGIAALLVVWQHTSESFVKLPGVAERGSWLADVAWSVDFGRIGVVCFFLISGFIIPYSFSSGPGAVRTFAIRRFFRLYPVYWASVVLAVLVGSAFAAHSWDTATLVANFTMIQKIIGYSHIQGLYWTLQVELIFYLLCGGIFYFGKMRSVPFLILATALLLVLFVGAELAFRTVLKGSDFPSELQYIPYFLSIMFCGAIIREIFLGEHSLHNRLIFALAPAAVFGIPAMVLFLYSLGFQFTQEPIRFGVSYLMALGIFIAAMFVRWPVPKPLAWLGLISYSIYLFHPVSMVLIRWAQRQPWAGFTESWGLWMYMSVAAAITIVLATVTYYVIERPSIRLGRYFSLRGATPSTHMIVQRGT